MKHKLLSINKPNSEGFVFDDQCCKLIYETLKTQIKDQKAFISHENNFNLDLTTVVGMISDVEMVDRDIFIKWEFLSKFSHLYKYPVNFVIAGDGHVNQVVAPIGVTKKIFKVSDFKLKYVVFKIVDCQYRKM
jgi:hypothetical protein